MTTLTFASRRKVSDTKGDEFIKAQGRPLFSYRTQRLRFSPLLSRRSHRKRKRGTPGVPSRAAQRPDRYLVNTKETPGEGRVAPSSVGRPLNAYEGRFSVLAPASIRTLVGDGSARTQKGPALLCLFFCLSPKKALNDDGEWIARYSHLPPHLYC